MDKINSKEEQKYVCDWGPNDEDVILDSDPEFSKYVNRKSKAKHYIKKFYDNHKFRYSLEYELNKNGKKDIAVILMNPSYADEQHLDNTLYNVKTFLENIDKKKEFNKFIVLNLFPIRTPNSENLISRMKNYKNQQIINDEKIAEILDSVQDVIVAWGKDYHFLATQKVWFKKLKNANKYAYGINDDGSPKHFSPYAYKYKQEDLKNKKLDNYRIDFKKPLCQSFVEKKVCHKH